MKKLTLILLALGLLVTSHTFSQKSNLKGSGEVFYSTTFDWADPDDQRGWSAPDGFLFEDPDNNGFNWRWYENDSLISSWTREVPFQSSSKEDGHLGLFLDEYNTLTGQEINVNNSIVFPTFDCSDKSSVVVRYETTFMNYAGSDAWDMLMLVSNDAGVHWAAFDVGFGCEHKDRPDDKPSGEPAIYEANISDVAAGMSEVIIKFTWTGTRLYFWLMDDFQMAEAWDNELRMTYYTLQWDDGDEDTNETYFYNIPKTMLNGGGFFNFESAVYNFGELDQDGVHMEVDVTKNNQSVWNVSTEETWVSPLIVDSVFIADKFTPEDFGHYKITMDFKQNQEEQFPENDIAEIFFNVTDSVYSRVDDTSEEKFVWGFEAYGDEGVPNEQHFVGNVFPIYADCEVDGVAVYVAGGLADGEIEFRGSLYWVPPPEEDPDGVGAIEWLSSEIVLLDSSMIDTWVYFPFDKDGESEFLFAGDKVYAGVEYWNWHTEIIPYKRYENFKIGSDIGADVQDPVSVAHSGVEAAWDTGGVLAKRKLMVKLYINNHENSIDGVDLTSAGNILKQNYPNPFTGSTEISYDLGNAADVSIEVMDMTGRVVKNLDEGMQPAGSHSIQLDASGLNSGVYFYTLKAGNYSETKRMIIN